ncbi:hypothetical protein Y032_0016g3069 [Ancylostoma ceylanicum]|uniref:Casein kinase II subunit beta n=1 Tax=Ancylostoma ceylanicum TaxID=53326 RepID=A0A016V6E0_9BILA|nr:hypothetical protein Y032_0016g3069 [Ancylostoma ceylanicum]
MNCPDESLDDSDGEDEEVERLAEKLYGLIHARFILTNRGLSMMLQKWQDGDFGTCPRVYCYDHPLLPMGTADVPGRDTVKMFCSSCNDIYQPRHTRHQALDGAYFGTSFPEMFLMMYPEFRGPKPQQFVPRFDSHSSSCFFFF